MRHRADQTLDGLARQLGVRVEGDDVADVGRDAVPGAVHGHEAGVGRSAQQAIQLVQLSAFALPAHPHALAGVPEPPAMEEEEAVAAARPRAVTLVEPRDGLARRGEGVLVPRHLLRRRVGPVGQDGEAEIAVGIRQVMHLEPLDLRRRLGGIGEQGRDDDEGPQRGRHALAQVEPRQDRRRKEARERTIHERDHQIGRGNERQTSEREQDRRADARGGGPDEEGRQEACGEHGDRSEIGRNRRPDEGPKPPAHRGTAEAEGLLEGRPPVTDEVVADVVVPGVVRPARVPHPGAFRVERRRPRDVELGPTRAARELFDRVAIAVAGREVHRAVARGRPEDAVDEADALEELRPVERRHQGHAQDHVAHRHVGGGLPLVLDPNDLVGRRPLGGQTLIQPQERGGDGRILIAQALDELDGERGHERALAEPLQPDRRRINRVAADAEHVVREGVGLLARGAPPHDRLRHAAEILDEHDPDRDRDRPELADRERLDTLVGVDEAAQRLGVQAAVGVRHERPRQAVDARIAPMGAVGELGQLAIEAGGQVVADLAELLLDDVEIVDEPLGRRRDGPLLADGAADRAIGRAQDTAVVVDALQQALPARRAAEDGLGGGQALGVLLEPLDPEELRPDRLFDAYPSPFTIR